MTEYDDKDYDIGSLDRFCIATQRHRTVAIV